MSDQFAFRRAEDQDFASCRRLYFEGMGGIIETLNLDTVRQSEGFACLSASVTSICKITYATMNASSVGGLPCSTTSTISPISLSPEELELIRREIEGFDDIDAVSLASEWLLWRKEMNSKAARMAEAQQKIVAANAPWWRGATARPPAKEAVRSVNSPAAKPTKGDRK